MMKYPNLNHIVFRREKDTKTKVWTEWDAVAAFLNNQAAHAYVTTRRRHEWIETDYKIEVL